jgi:sugar/nucleoside kinase (ribokinase family)
MPDSAERKQHVPEVWTPNGGIITDTVGAGDAFIAAVICTMLKRSQDQPEFPWDQVLEVLREANQIAGTKVCQEGFDGLVDKCIIGGYWTTWFCNDGEF